MKTLITIVLTAGVLVGGYFGYNAYRNSLVGKVVQAQNYQFVSSLVQSYQQGGFSVGLSSSTTIQFVSAPLCKVSTSTKSNLSSVK